MAVKYLSSAVSPDQLSMFVYRLSMLKEKRKKVCGDPKAFNDIYKVGSVFNVCGCLTGGYRKNLMYSSILSMSLPQSETIGRPGA